MSDPAAVTAPAARASLEPRRSRRRRIRL